MALPWRSAERSLLNLGLATREMGLSRRDTLRVLEVSALAAVLAWHRHPRGPWRANAVRHVAWQAWLSARYGERVAWQIAEAHERLSTDPLDHEVDERNNHLARTIGLHWCTLHRDHRPPRLRDVPSFADLAEQAWDRGELFTGRGGRLHRSVADRSATVRSRTRRGRGD